MMEGAIPIASSRFTQYRRDREVCRGMVPIIEEDPKNRLERAMQQSGSHVHAESCSVCHQYIEHDRAQVA
jgi:hypothetical protein